MKRIIWSVICLGLGAMLGWAQPYASESVLSQGTWYKIGVQQTGMVKLDRGFLASLGMDVDGLDPRNLQLYGNGGGMLPQANAVKRADDLVQNPIRLVGEGDGRFDAGDYIAFFAEGPDQWRYDSEVGDFRHELHAYSDTNFYFLRLGNSPGLRVSATPGPGTASQAATQLRNVLFHDRELENPINSGRVWLGERMDLTTQRRFRFFLPDAANPGSIRILTRVAARSDRPTFFTLSVNGQVVSSGSVSQVNIQTEESIYYRSLQLSATVGTNAINANDSLVVTLEYNANGSSRSEGWLDWIELSYDQSTNVGNRSQWMGYIHDNVGVGTVQSLQLRNAGSSYEVWDVTDPTQARGLTYSSSGSTLSLNLATDSIKRLVAFRDAPLRPISGSRISNQNLHGLGLVDYLVITNRAFLTDARRLANFHSSHYGRSTAVVTVEQIYHEFSSGKQDVSAIRDFIRMFYVRSDGLAPGFVCLFGDGTYIYKNISEARNRSTNFVPTYQSRDSRHPTRSFTSDDFFVLLEEDEGYWGEGSGYEGDSRTDVNTLDAAIGRLPVENQEQAQQIVDKIIGYATANTYGPWRNRVVLVADHRDSDGTTHVSQADGYTNSILQQAACTEVEKIYMDNYRMIITAGNESFPEGRDAVLRAMDRGSLILNYTGHGSENAWSYSGIFRNSDIDDIDNAGRTPAIVTATCEFGRYDNPEKRSGAELFMMHPEVGAIAMFTTVRLVYASPNRELNANFYQHVFDFDSLRGRMPSMGEVMMRTKNSTFPNSDFTNINSRNFTLLGDPGLILNYPEKQAYITHINDRPVDPGTPDTLRSLGLVQVGGVVADEFGEIMPAFDGNMELTVFDKPSTYTTKRDPFTFTWQNNRIFNGRAAAVQGDFDFEFVVPIDISYENGYGKIVAYFNNDETDGVGCYDNLYIGGTDANAVPDVQGPDVSLYLNDSNWRDGSLTSPNPDLYALLSDENGINTTGTGIGHEITAVLDDNEEEVLILNDYYIADQGSYQRGAVRYPMENLEPGFHRLRIRVWDVANNSSEDETTFVVADDAEMALEQVLNYPNPFDPNEGVTRFLINHNMDGQSLRLEVDIFGRDGRIVHQISQDLTPSGNVTENLTWDGTNGIGTPLSSGLYVYRVRLTRLDTGESIYATRRLVMIRG